MASQDSFSLIHQKQGFRLQDGPCLETERCLFPGNPVKWKEETVTAFPRSESDRYLGLRNRALGLELMASSELGKAAKLKELKLTSLMKGTSQEYKRYNAIKVIFTTCK